MKNEKSKGKFRMRNEMGDKMKNEEWKWKQNE